MSANRVPVFVINGFLESGKTSFIRDAILRDPGVENEHFLVICCEEGVEDIMDLPDTVDVHIIDEAEDLTEERLQQLNDLFAPTYVVIEYNSIWGMKLLYELPLPDGWRLSQQFTIIDALTFRNYYSNMKAIFADMLRLSTRVYVNRCKRDDDFRFYRDSIKACAPRTDIYYLNDEEGSLDIMLEEDLPYDLTAPVIDINDDSYLIWYVDMLDNIDRYNGKTVEFSAVITHPEECRPGYFFAGNDVMTCCEEDIQFLSLVCHSPEADSLEDGAYMRLRGEVRYEFAPEYGEEDAVIYITHAELIPESEEEE